MATKLHPSFAVHPGPWLRTEIIEPHRLSLAATAVALGVTRVAMSNLVNGKAALSAAMALRFENAFGVSAETLMRMQTAYDLAQARAGHAGLDVRRIVEPA